MRRARPVPYRHLIGTLWPVNQNLPADWPRLAEAGRSYRPRLQAEATGRLGLELALAGRIKAGQGKSAKSARAMQLGDCWPPSSVPVARAWRWSRCRSTRLRASGESSV